MSHTASLNSGFPACGPGGYSFIYAHEELVESWIFKGGTCLKKCFFETYRFSEDLDFTLRDEAQLDESVLKGIFAEVGAWIYEATGIEIPADQQEFDIYRNPPR
jgi:predicted nucleotidyltransferase component of viral defense system